MLTPGSTRGIDHPFAWYAVVEERPDSRGVPGKRWTMWFNGNITTREQVADHIAWHYRNVNLITADRADKAPGRVLQPVPLHFFESGARIGALGLDERILKPGRVSTAPKPIALKPLY